MQQTTYLYDRIIGRGLLEDILTAPKIESALQDRVAKILKGFVLVDPRHIPSSLKSEWSIIQAAYDCKIKPGNLWRATELDQKAQSLSRSQARDVLKAFFTTTVETIRNSHTPKQ